MFFSIIKYFFLGYSGYYLYKNFIKSPSNIYSTVAEKALHFFNYKIDNSNLDSLDSKMIIVGTHTSIYDFFIGLLYYYAFLNKKYTTYVFMKKDFEKICTPILAFIDKKFKIISVDGTKNNLIEKTCNLLKTEDNYVIFIAPEGTRKCTEKLRTGYWYICKNMDINVAYMGIDFNEKSIYLDKPRKVNEDWNKEMEWFISECKKYIPLYPERCFWIRDYYDFDGPQQQSKS